VNQKFLSTVPPNLRPATLLLCCGFTAILAFVFLWAIFKSSEANNVSILALTIIAGAMGGMLSALYNLVQSTSEPMDLQVSSGGLRVKLVAALPYPLAAIALGALCAGALYAIFAADILSGGAFFPKFSCAPNKDCGTLNGFINDFRPEKAADYARLLIWSFAAGFAEQLVPDKLKGLFSFGGK
jgi:hypothetical protein